VVTITKSIQFLLSLLTLAFFIWLGWKGFAWLKGGHENLPANSQSLMIVIAVLVLVSTYMLANAIRESAKVRALYPIKARLFEAYLNTWQQVDLGSDEKHKRLTQLQLQLLIYCNGRIIRQMNTFLEALANGSISNTELSELATVLLLEMRADLGGNNLLASKTEIRKTLQFTETEKAK
jgi:hypothetical protein